MTHINLSFRCYVCNSDQCKFVMPYRAIVTDSMFRDSHIVKCNSCGLLQIDKKFSPAEIEKYYKSEYDREDIYNFDFNLFPLDNTWSVSRGRALAKLVKRFDLVKQLKTTILDLGCGYGHLIYGFSNYFDSPCTLIGVDYEPKTKQLFDKYKWDFEQGGIDDVYRKYTGKVDILITSHVFEHIIDPRDFLHKCSNMLVSEGVLLWEVPNLNEYNLECELRHSPHICLWDIHSLRRILEKNNFEVLFLETAGRKYSWFDKKRPLNIMLNRIYRKIRKVSNESFELSNKESISYQLDVYGFNRRNLRLIARKKE